MNVFAVRAAELTENRPELAAAVVPLLSARAAIEQQIADLDRKVMRLARNNAQARRFMTAPGVGPITALCFLATIDDPTRFKRSRSVGAYLGLTTCRYASGEIDWTGRISKCGDKMLRSCLYEAANVMLTRVARWSALKAWGIRVAKRTGLRKAKVAVARKHCCRSAPDVDRRHRIQMVKGGRQSTCVCRVGLRIVLFEACSAFTRVAACTLALSPMRDTLIEGFSHFVSSMTAPIASGWSGCRVGFALTGKPRLVTAHTRFGHLNRRETGRVLQRP